MAGRPTKKDEATVATIIETLNAGGTHKSAYLRAGISHDTYAEWRKNDKDFAFKVDQAFQKGNLGYEICIRRAAEPRTVTETTTVSKIDLDADGKPVGNSTTTTTKQYEELGDWRAAVRALQARDPENWASKVDLKKDGDGIKGYGAFVDFEDL